MNQIIYNIVRYLLVSGISLSVFLLLYKILFSKTSFLKLNRAYLIGGMVFSSVLPIIKIHLYPIVPALDQEFVVFKALKLSDLIQGDNSKEFTSFNWVFVLSALYITGMGWFTFKLCNQLVQIKRLIKTGERKIISGHSVIVTDSAIAPSSFLNHIFINKSLSNDDLTDQVLKHEQIHKERLHTVDLIFAEILNVIHWFNPIIRIYTKSIVEIHEYIADSEVISDGLNPLDYQYSLVNQQYNQLLFSLIHSFNKTLIGKRVQKIQAKKTSIMIKYLYLLVLPILVFLLMAFSVQNPIRQISTGLNISVPHFQEDSGPKGLPINEDYLVRISNDFGVEFKNPFTNKVVTHGGIDLAAKTGTPVMATASGKIVKAKENNSWGKFVGINHMGGYATFYSHLESFIVSEGDYVEAGQVIGYVGTTGYSTGPHLHYEVRKDNERLNPADFF